MALLYRADLRPTKLQMLNGWLPARPWYRGPAAPDFQRVVSFRFDDPDGQVGVETLLVHADGGPILQVPLTYRGAPLDGLEPWLIGTSEHSVLGRRWVYDGCGDPVYVNALAQAIWTGGTQAEEFLDVDGERERREPSMRVLGSGAAQTSPDTGGPIRADETDPTLILAGTVELGIIRVLGVATTDHELALTATWNDQPDPVLLAYARSL